jgi:hypothetical protein
MKMLIVLTMLLLTNYSAANEATSNNVAAQFEPNQMAMRVADLALSVSWWKRVFRRNEK